PTGVFNYLLLRLITHREGQAWTPTLGQNSTPVHKKTLDSVPFTSEYPNSPLTLRWPFVYFRTHQFARMPQCDNVAPYSRRGFIAFCSHTPSLASTTRKGCRVLSY